mgnify:FL=1
MNKYAEEYKSSTESFLNLVNTLNPNDLDISDSEGWSPRQVIHHMADSETQSYARLRKLIAEPGSVIQGYDEGKWAENPTLGYQNLPIEDSVAVIKAVRKSSYELIKRLSDEELSHKCIHSESGEYSVKNWLDTYTNHPTDHLNQIKNLLNK